MKKYLADWLMWVSDVAKKLAAELHPPQITHLEQRACEIVYDQEMYTTRSGEAKHYQAIRVLQREFPGERKRRLNYLIEKAVNEL